jgi:hypothetical protein
MEALKERCASNKVFAETAESIRIANAVIERAQRFLNEKKSGKPTAGVR